MIKRGCSLYSFQEDYYEGRRDLEGCIAAAAAAGATGIESLAEQMMPGFPNLDDEFYARYAGWMRTYGTVSWAHDLFLDTKRYKDRLLTFEEMTASVRRDIDHAAKLGAKVIRVIVNTPPEVVEACAAYARDRGVKLCVEIHSPWFFDHPWIRQHLDVADRVGTDAVGCIPDLGIFVRRFPRVIVERALRDGADEKTTRDAEKNYNDGGDTQAVLEKIEAAGASPATLGVVRTMTHFINGDVKTLADHIGYIASIHAKFYEMTDEGEEYSIPYGEIISTLAGAGYDSYLCSEYEGNRHIQDVQQVDSFGQVQAHQQMMARYIEAAI